MATTITELFNEQVANNGDAPALRMRHGDQWQATSWTEYGRQVRALALALRARGIERGSSVAIISDCLPQFFITDMATVALGAKTASIYQTNSPEQVLYVLENSDAPIIFCEDEGQVRKVASVRDRVRNLLIVTFATETGSADLTFDQLVAEGSGIDASEPTRYFELVAKIDPDDAACIIYTSGTTGPPKAALISHRSVLTVLNAIQTLWPNTHNDYRVVSYLPLAHIAERAMSLYSQTMFGGEVWFSNVNTLARDLSECHPTRLLAVPRVWEKFEEALRAKLPVPPAMLPAEKKAGVLTMLGMDQVQVAISGAAPISAETLQYFADLGVEILEVFGMTETTGLSTANPAGAAKIGTVGKPVPGVEIKLADDNEILIRGANFSGYLKNPHATEEALEDGWMHSGDLGSLDEDGYLTIIGRKKDLIITAGGENISPNNIQLLLTRSPFISQAVAVGDKRRFISALITLSEEAIRPWAAERGLAELSSAELARNEQVRELIDAAVAEANQHLARVQQVRRYEILPRDFSIEAGELTPTMKLKRTVIETDYSDVIEQIYAS